MWRSFLFMVVFFWAGGVHTAAKVAVYRVEPRKNRFSRKAAKKITKTRLADLAEAFENGVLVGVGLFSDIDTAHLLKACRKFEAHMKRVGETQSAKDLHNNIGKVEDLYHAAPTDKRRTMSSLLRYEKELGIHPAPPKGHPHQHRLKDPSGAMGLLWIQRSLSFNYKLYTKVVDSPHTSTAKAAMAAYHSVLEPYHGWALRRLYTLGLQSGTPPRRAMLARLGGFDDRDNGSHLTLQQEQATVKDMQRLLQAWRPLLVKWKQVFKDLDLDDRRRV